MGSFGGTATLARAASVSVTAAFYFGLLGNGTALFLFLSSIPTFRRICRNNDVGETREFPYMAGVVNCLVWALYGLPSVQHGGELGLGVNVIGLFCNVIYTIIFLHFAGERRLLLSYALVIEIFASGSLAPLLLIVPRTAESHVYWLGVCGAITASIMYLVPVLTDMFHVWNTGAVQHISLMGPAAALLNAVIWTIYALLPKFKIFTFVPNIVGVGAGLLEFSVYVYYRYYRNAQQAVVLE